MQVKAMMTVLQRGTISDQDLSRTTEMKVVGTIQEHEPNLDNTHKLASLESIYQIDDRSVTPTVWRRGSRIVKSFISTYFFQHLRHSNIVLLEGDNVAGGAIAEGKIPETRMS
jgi:hypothetical protein